MGANSDDEQEENTVVAEAGEDVVDVTKGVLKAAADLVSKTGVVLLLIIIVGIVLLVIRDLIYQASAWSTTELVVIVAAWDAWVLYTDYATAQAKAVAVAVELIVDALKAFGINLGVSFSLNSILTTALGPLISPWELKKLSEQVGVCEGIGNGAEVFGFAIKYVANDGVCPSVRYLRPTLVGPVVNFFAGWLTFGSDPTQYNSCTCNPAEYPCESVGTCLVLNSGYIFTEVLAPALLAGLLLWYTLADVLALIGRVAEAVLVYIKAGAVSFVETVEHYASKLHS